jgi:hypothetical protein
MSFKKENELSFKKENEMRFFFLKREFENQEIKDGMVSFGSRRKRWGEKLWDWKITQCGGLMPIPKNNKSY